MPAALPAGSQRMAVWKTAALPAGGRRSDRLEADVFFRWLEYCWRLEADAAS